MHTHLQIVSKNNFGAFQIAKEALLRIEQYKKPLFVAVLFSPQSNLFVRAANNRKAALSLFPSLSTLLQIELCQKRPRTTRAKNTE
jgi:hypothetical protein